MDGVGTPIIGRPRPLPGHDTPNPAYHPHTLNYEEPVNPDLNGSHSFAVADTTDNYYAKSQTQLFLEYFLVIISAAMILLETVLIVASVRNIWRASKEHRQLQAEFPAPLPAYMPASASAGPTATASPEYRPTQL